MNGPVEKQVTPAGLALELLEVTESSVLLIARRSIAIAVSSTVSPSMKRNFETYCVLICAGDYVVCIRSSSKLECFPKLGYTLEWSCEIREVFLAEPASLHVP